MRLGRHKSKAVKGGAILGGIASALLLFAGIMGAIFAAIGSCVFCMIPILAFVLGLFGMSAGFLYDYNIWVIALGVICFGLSVFLWLKRKKWCKKCKDGECKVKNSSKKK